jgi:DNA-binding CsgD family transcriptional regulator
MTAARSWYQQSLELALELGDKSLTPFNLEGLAGVVAVQGELIWAGQLWGAAEALREATAVPVPPVDRVGYERAVVTARAHLGEQAFTSAWAEGRTMTPEQAGTGLHLASLSEPVPEALQPSSPTSPNDLTAREMDVLRLLAQGLTSAQIAKQLVIGVVTVNFHVRSIYSKLGVSSRSAATRYAIEHNLV